MDKLAVQQTIAKLKPTLAGRFIYRWIPFRKKVIHENIQRVFQSVLNDQEQKKLAQCYYSHLATSVKETLLSRFQSVEAVKKAVQVKGAEHLFAASQENKGILILTGHFGNWEYAPIGGLMQFPDYRDRFHFIRKTLSMKWLEKILFRRYFSAGIQVIPKKNAIPTVINALERNDAVVFVMDQAASLKNKQGIATLFFGHPVGTYRSLATIARSTGAPVVVGTSYRDHHGQHVMEFLPMLNWISAENAKQEILLNTQNYNHILEKLVLAHPDQWLWVHRRWK